MSGKPAIASRPSMVSLILDRGIVRRALIVGAIVGTILNLIAQGDFLLMGQTLNYWKIVLTYLVPYCVATYGGVTAKLESYKRADWQ